MDEISVLIIGKPNVGKSTLFNNLSEDNISIVDDTPGTTVLPHCSKIKFKDIVINLVDVGGLKKKSKSHDKKQKLITKETLKNLKHSDIVLFLTEANSEFTKNDKQIFRLVLNKLKDFIIIVNKIDLIEKSKISKVKRYFTYFFENTFSDILIKPLFFSAKENKERDFFFKKIYNLNETKKNIIKNKELNTFINNIKSFNIPAQRGQFRPTIKFIKHVNTKPQIFKIFGNRLQKLNSDYKKYMLKQIINKFELYNQVVIIKYISNKNPFSRSNVAKKR